MATGELCVHCGWQETDHEFRREQSRPGKRRKGYERTLLSCRGFEISPREETEGDKERQAFKIYCWERQAQGAVAWGAFSACMRQQNFNKELKERNEAVSRASSEDRERLKAERDAWVRRCKNDNTIHIGPY